MNERIVLGTANFFQPYWGVMAKNPDDILRCALDNGINFVDYSPSYGGSADKFIGRFLVNNKVSKVEDANPYCLINSIHYAKDIGIYDELKTKTNCIGFSAYYPEEIGNKHFHLLQVPYSIIDQRFRPMVRMYKEVWARSVFMRGRAGEYRSIIELSAEHRIPVAVLCLLYPLVCNFDKVIIGVDSVEHLKTAFEAEKYYSRVCDLYHELKQMQSNNPDEYDPLRWLTK